MSLHDSDEPLIRRGEAQERLGDQSADKMRELEKRGLLTPIRFGAPPYAHVFYRQVTKLQTHGVPAAPEARPLKRAPLRRRAEPDAQAEAEAAAPPRATAALDAALASMDARARALLQGSAAD